MKAIFTYLTGGRAGQAVVVEKSYAMLGRAPFTEEDSLRAFAADVRKRMVA